MTRCRDLGGIPMTDLDRVEPHATHHMRSMICKSLTAVVQGHVIIAILLTKHRMVVRMMSIMAAFELMPRV